ncbi:MAG: hypothetical protein B6U73_00135 [Desulfurococcales archaeon ex4484_204]|nr:MAG: hypothetical protein B6U73_00135 [Desulfurococcales archaeon ex4484_204]
MSVRISIEIRGVLSGPSFTSLTKIVRSSNGNIKYLDIAKKDFVIEYRVLEPLSKGLELLKCINDIRKMTSHCELSVRGVIVLARWEGRYTPAEVTKSLRMAFNKCVKLGRFFRCVGFINNHIVLSEYVTGGNARFLITGKMCGGLDSWKSVVPGPIELLPFLKVECSYDAVLGTVNALYRVVQEVAENIKRCKIDSMVECNEVRAK